MQTMLIDQIISSKLSKQGKTTLSGVFEGQPENALTVNRGYNTPTGNMQFDQPLGNAIAFKNTQAVANTYLEHLKNEKRI